MTRVSGGEEVQNAPQRLSVTSLIVLFGVFLVLVAWGGTFLYIRNDLEIETARVVGENNFIAGALEEHARRVLRTADNSLRYLKEEYEKSGAVTEGMRHFGQMTKSDLSAVQVALSDPAGNLIYSAVPLKAPLNISEREHFKVHLKSADVGLFVGKPVKSVATGTWTFFLSRRLNRPDGTFNGIVSIGLDPFYLGGMYDKFELGSVRAGLLVGKDHIVRVRVHPKVKTVGDDISNYSPVFEEAALTPVGDYEVVTEYSPVPRMASYRVMPDYPLLSIVSVEKPTALQNFTKRRNTTLLGTSLFTLFVAGFCYFLARAERSKALAGERLREELAQRRKAQQELRESKELFTAFMDHMPALVSLHDDRRDTLYRNKAFVEFFGPEDGGDSRAREAFLERALACDPLALPEGGSFEEIPLRDGRGRNRIVASNCFLVARGEKPPYLGSIALDITEQKEAEQERLSLERKILRAQQAESLGILAGGIAHDFNNLLMGMMGNIDLALMGLPPDSPLHPMLKRAEACAQRAAELTNQMLAYSGKGHFVIEPVNLSVLVGEMAHLLSTVHTKQVEVRYRMSDNLPPVEGDATQLRQVVMNLITNAADSYGQGSGVVRVSTGVADKGAVGLPDEPGYVYFEVADEGLGMDASTQARIFDPFFTTKRTGRGLGLAAVQGIVRGHGGKIDLSSQPGKGTTFRVYLPIASAEEAAPAAGEHAACRLAQTPAASGTILLVDDEETVRATAGMILEMRGYEVLHACDGVEGVELFGKNAGRISAVILDMSMPRMGGSEAFEEMRKINPRVPVILSSGFSEEEAISRFKGRRLAGFIQKPYRANDLLEKLGEILASPAA